MLYVYLVKMYILLLLSGVLCKCQLGQVDGTVQEFYVLTDFLLLVLLIIEKAGVEISNIIVDVSVSSYSSIIFTLYLLKLFS